MRTSNSEQLQQLLEDACAAQERFTLDELEEYAALRLLTGLVEHSDDASKEV